MRALLLCASHNDLGLIRALRKLGYYIICTGSLPGQIGEKYVDEYIQADYSDKELILKLAKDKKIDVICQCCNDFGVYTAAYVADKLDLPGYDDYETTLLLHNKDRFKQFAKENDICTPIAEVFTDEETAILWCGEGNYPLIIKPIDASAGNGVSRVDNIEEARICIQKAFQASRGKKIVIEPYITGSQHGFCTFLINGKVAACSSNNEYSILNPYRVEIDTFPADNFEGVKETLIAEIEKIAALLNLKDGIFHLQYIMHENKPLIIEVMRRILGNMYSVPANLLNNMDWDYWETRVRCGLDCNEFPKHIRQEGFYAYKTILAEKNGTIASIEIPLDYEKYLLGSVLLKQVGEKIKNYRSTPIGFLFFMFSSQEEMKRVLIENYRNSMVTVE